MSGSSEEFLCFRLVKVVVGCCCCFCRSLEQRKEERTKKKETMFKGISGLMSGEEGEERAGMGGSGERERERKK